MKTKLHSMFIVIAVCIAGLGAANLRAAETNTPPVLIGVYDSRAVAYAWFWSGKHQKQLNELMQTARAAKAAGDRNRFKELNAALRRQQDEIHREVFSTAPATNALAALRDRLPTIGQAAGVSVLVFKWDDATLKKFSNIEKVEVTDKLVGELITPTPQQQKVISAMKTTAPISLDRCEELIRKGKL